MVTMILMIIVMMMMMMMMMMMTVMVLVTMTIIWRLILVVKPAWQASAKHLELRQATI